jgi:hypothetical protein
MGGPTVFAAAAIPLFASVTAKLASIHRAGMHHFAKSGLISR